LKKSIRQKFKYQGAVCELTSSRGGYRYYDCVDELDAKKVFKIKVKGLKVEKRNG